MNSSNRLKSGGEDSPFFHTPKLPESLIGASEVYANTITTSPIILQQPSSKVDMAVLKRLRSFDSEDLGFSKRRFSESRPSLEGSFRTTKIPPSKSEQNEASTTQDFVSAKKKGFNDKSDKVIQDHVFTPPQIRASLHERDSKSHKSSPSKNESETKHSDSSEFVYENGSSCHQCKRRTPFRALTFCKNMFNYKGRLNPNKVSNYLILICVTEFLIFTL